MYALLSFRFWKDQAGRVLTSFSFKPVRFTDEFGIITWLWNKPSDWLTRIKLWLTMINYTMVVLRTVNEAAAARDVKRDRGSYLPYFGSIFTCLELFNLTCNYVGLALRFILTLYPGRNHFQNILHLGAEVNIMEQVRSPRSLPPPSWRTQSTGFAV